MSKESTTVQNERPEWCPHADCVFIAVKALHAMCGGRLVTPEPHDGVMNTHRFCIDTCETGHGVFDLQVNRGDIWWFQELLKLLREDAQ